MVCTAREGERNEKEEGAVSWRCWHLQEVLLGVQSEQEVAQPRPRGLHAPVSFDSMKKTREFCKMSPHFGWFSSEKQNNTSFGIIQYFAFV
jgi:hypothetical protein